MAKTKEFDNTNRGALFKNDKEGNEKRPDYAGPLDVEGTEYRAAAWLRDKKDGSGKFLSLQIEKKDESESPGKVADDDIPF